MHTTFFLEIFCAELPAAPSDGFLFSLELVAFFGACSGRGTGFAGAFLAGFGTARAATGLAGGATAFCKTTNRNQIKCFRVKKSAESNTVLLAHPRTCFAKAAFFKSWAPKLLVMGRLIPSGSWIFL